MTIEARLPGLMGLLHLLALQVKPDHPIRTAECCTGLARPSQISQITPGTHCLAERERLQHGLAAEIRRGGILKGKCITRFETDATILRVISPAHAHDLYSKLPFLRIPLLQGHPPLFVIVALLHLPGSFLLRSRTTHYPEEACLLHVQRRA